MSRPDVFDSREMIDAVARIRAAGAPVEADDEDLALLVEGGIGAVPPAARAELLCAIGQSPELAAVVAELASSRSGARAAEPSDSRFDPRRSAWRIAWAACALTALSLTSWLLLDGGTRAAPGDVLLLDSAVVAAREAPSFADWFAGTPLRVTIAVLWILLCFLTFPALPPAPGTQSKRPGAPR